MPLIETLGSAVAGGIATVALQQGIKRYRKPRLHLKWFRNRGREISVVDRTISKKQVDTQHGKLFTENLTKDVHLSLKNTGRSAAKECSIKAEVYEGPSRNPQPVRLGTRINPPILYEDLNKSEQIRERTSSFRLNPDDRVLVDLLRLSYRKSYYEDKEEADSTDPTEMSLHTLESFRNIEFKKYIKYNIRVTVTASNARPARMGIVLDWDGEASDKSIRSSMTTVDPNTLYL